MNALLLFFLLLFPGVIPRVVAQALVDGQQAPAFEVTLLDDSIARSSDIDGEVVFLALLRTTLPSQPKIACAQSIGLLNLIDKEILARFPGEEDLVVLPVFTRRAGKQEIIRLRDKYRLAFPIGLDRGGKVFSRFAGDDEIHLFVIDRQGKIAEVPYTRAFTNEERARYKSSTGKNLPPSRLSLEEAARVIEDALAVVPSGGIDFRPLTFAEALALARKENKRVLVNCYVPWYAPCQYLLKRVFTRRVAGEYCNARFVCVKFDMEEREGARLQKRFDLSLTEPTTLLLEPDGTVLYRHTGSAPVAEWLAGIAGSVNE
ncbi:MAG: thioredoxin family protein [Odoribacteraceae bacterium]|jgi:peroxiredoxin|nr:thioredoxin family protein [Odoribacteraceae bacterium]